MTRLGRRGFASYKTVTAGQQAVAHRCAAPLLLHCRQRRLEGVQVEVETNDSQLGCRSAATRRHVPRGLFCTADAATGERVGSAGGIVGRELQQRLSRKNWRTAGGILPSPTSAACETAAGRNNGSDEQHRLPVRVWNARELLPRLPRARQDDTRNVPKNYQSTTQSPSILTAVRTQLTAVRTERSQTLAAGTKPHDSRGQPLPSTDDE